MSTRRCGNTSIGEVFMFIRHEGEINSDITLPLPKLEMANKSIFSAGGGKITGSLRTLDF